MPKVYQKIETGSRVAIVGGGPAGAFFALYLLRYAEKRGIHPEITIYQKSNFAEPGPKGCKGCAGVLSISLLKNLQELGLTIPDEIIQSKIEHYAVHTPDISLSISNPEKETEIASIYRGNGPRLSHYKSLISFDAWLLRQAQNRGARLENETVSQIFPGHETGIEVARRKLSYDLVVLAAGINTKPIPILGMAYIPPKTRMMALGELQSNAEQIKSRLGNTAHAFFLPHSGLIFGTLVPKGPFINVCVLSSRETPVSVSDFLRYDIVRDVLPGHYDRVCDCQARAAVGYAQNYYADKFVAVGDAVVSRLYKDGIASALVTAREAARTSIYHGLSHHDFEQYYQPLCRSIDRDNRWGRLLFSIDDRAKDSRTFLFTQQRLLGNEQNKLRGSQSFTQATWGMLTGSYSYKSIATLVLAPASLAKLSAAFLREGLRGLLHKGVTSPRRLSVASRKVLILGSGFGGTYALRHLVPSLNRNENVETTMVSDENFFLFSPLLHEAAMGRIETRHIAYPIRRLNWRDRFNFRQTSIEKIDLSHRQVITKMGSLGFDYLVLALGSITDVTQLDSMQENVFTLKTLHDAILIRNHIISVFEQASAEREPERQKQLLTFIVSGAGYTGIQLVTELRDFLHRGLLRFYKTIDPNHIRIILVEVESKIVAELHTKLGAYVMKHLQDAGIEVRLRSRVTRVWEDRVEINDAENVPTSTLIWVAGVRASPQIAEADIEKDNIGRVLVNEYMEVPGVPGVYAVGDCAHFKDPRSGRPIPPRAHTAVRQAKIAAHNILADIRGSAKQPYRYSNPTEMITLGDSNAVFRFHSLRLYGFLARFIWLVGYSLLVTGNYNRTRIMLDWLLSLVFGRDTTFLKIKK